MDQSQLAQQPRRPLSPSELAAIARWNNWALEAQGERSPGGESEPLLEELVAALDSFYESLEAGVSSSSPPSSPSSTRSSSKLSFHTCAEEADETPIMAPTQPFDAGHNDRVTAVHANFYGTRILTASIDHRIKVWERDPKTGERTLLDTFTAHDADIRDAKFLHPTLGNHLVSIGNDLKCHVWAEDATQPPRQGHRFRRIATIPSTPRVPFVSLDVKTLTTDHVTTFLALIDRQGLLSIYEPSSGPDDLREWTVVDSFNVCAPSPSPGRGDETSFKVEFDPNPTPLGYINSVSDERDQLNLVVCAMNEVKIFRSVVPQNGGGGEGSTSGIGGIGLGMGISTTGSGTPSGIGSGGGGESHRIMFYEAIKLPIHPALVRDVAWAQFSVRGTDRIATACKDGTVRIFELGVAPSTSIATSTGENDPSSARNGAEHTSSTTTHQARASLPQRPQQQSSLTSAIAGRQPSSSSTNPAPSASAHHHGSSVSRAHFPPPYTTTLSSVTNLAQAHTDAWSVSFDSAGQVLLSTGSDGVTKLWRKSVLSGQWMVFSVQDITDDDEDDEDVTDEDDEGERDEAHYEGNGNA